MDPQPHESSTWTTSLNLGPGPVDAAAFAELMRHPDYPRASAYDPAWVYRNLMGPHPLWLTEALTQVLPLEPGMRVLDLGCGAAISSIFLARELGVEVWATDLWIEPSENRTRIEEAGLGDRVFPIEAEAHCCPSRTVLRRAREHRLVPLLRDRRALPLVRRAVRSPGRRDRHRRTRERNRSR